MRFAIRYEYTVLNVVLLIQFQQVRTGWLG